MYLVDTNVLSEARRGNVEARLWLRSVDPASLYLSVITLGEIMKGIALKGRTDPRAAGQLKEWLETLRRDHGDRTLPVTERVALEWGRLAAKKSRNMADGLIAATAIAHEMIVVTRNVTDFADAQIQIIDPWNC